MLIFSVEREMSSFQSEVNYGLTNEIRHTTEKYGIKIPNLGRKRSKYKPFTAFYIEISKKEQPIS